MQAPCGSNVPYLVPTSTNFYKPPVASAAVSPPSVVGERTCRTRAWAPKSERRCCKSGPGLSICAVLRPRREWLSICPARLDSCLERLFICSSGKVSQWNSSCIGRPREQLSPHPNCWDMHTCTYTCVPVCSVCVLQWKCMKMNDKDWGRTRCGGTMTWTASEDATLKTRP
ncbi:hypothetical protein N656DRAFT_568731 [Canariomyces notabilis]|uniref:Uncharacterized protein n=1 Tax=Canariomyces notabilis TaxID=2074819 RepID=A0AAN6YUB7_9PEZI|nr:hypothetical protein N656DRAFT_568731 [Canariomyces arenarius]